jgi:hypothetical protein
VPSPSINYRERKLAGASVFVLNKDDERLFIHVAGHIDRLHPDFMEWLELFIGRYREATSHTVRADGWFYDEILDEDDKVLNILLTIDDPKHAAMFKLIYGYDLI